jgi:hypothetical protein
MRPAVDAAVGTLAEGLLVDLEPLETELLKTLWASRLEDVETLYNPTKIVTIVDHISKKFPDQQDVGPYYRILCEVAHPNMHIPFRAKRTNHNLPESGTINDCY